MSEPLARTDLIDDEGSLSLQESDIVELRSEIKKLATDPERDRIPFDLANQLNGPPFRPTSREEKARLSKVVVLGKSKPGIG